jgi:hypothetical protein
MKELFVMSAIKCIFGDMPSQEVDDASVADVIEEFVETGVDCEVE